MKNTEPRAMGIELTEIVRAVYNKIAEWNNEDISSKDIPEGQTRDDIKGERLKFLSHEIVDQVLTSAFEQLDGVKTKTQVTPGKEITREKVNIEKLTTDEKQGYNGIFAGILKNKKNKS